jgi:hypothetical protein
MENFANDRLSKEISEKMEQTRGLRRRLQDAATFSEFLQK